jgi:hypothetical protein
VSLNARLAYAERALAILRPGLRVITIRGGLTADASGDIATIDGDHLKRLAGETSDGFRARARAAAIAAGARTLIYGGLPQHGDGRTKGE